MLQSVSEALPSAAAAAACRSRVPGLTSSLAFTAVCENMRCIREEIVFFSCVFEGVAVPDAKADPGKDRGPVAEASGSDIG